MNIQNFNKYTNNREFLTCTTCTILTHFTFGIKKNGLSGSNEKNRQKKKNIQNMNENE